eukprot:1725352-Rhodomonas_salina.1
MCIRDSPSSVRSPLRAQACGRRGTLSPHPYRSAPTLRAQHSPLGHPPSAITLTTQHSPFRHPPLSSTRELQIILQSTAPGMLLPPTLESTSTICSTGVCVGRLGSRYWRVQRALHRA